MEISILNLSNLASFIGNLVAFNVQKLKEKIFKR